jgi:hypothetical protein
LKIHENAPFIVDLPIQNVIFYSYVSLPEGMTTFSGKTMTLWCSHCHGWKNAGNIGKHSWIFHGNDDEGKMNQAKRRMITSSTVQTS